MTGFRDGKAEHHFSDLNLFAAISALCEASLAYSARGKDALAHINRICGHEQQMQLRAYDRAALKGDADHG